MHQPASINLTFQSNKYEALWSIICGFKDNIECIRVLVFADTNTPFPSQHSLKVCLLSDAAAKVCQNHDLVTGVRPTATGNVAPFPYLLLRALNWKPVRDSQVRLRLIILIHQTFYLASEQVFAKLFAINI